MAFIHLLIHSFTHSSIRYFWSYVLTTAFDTTDIRQNDHEHMSLWWEDQGKNRKLQLILYLLGQEVSTKCWGSSETYKVCVWVCVCMCVCVLMWVCACVCVCVCTCVWVCVCECESVWVCVCMHVSVCECVCGRRYWSLLGVDVAWDERISYTCLCNKWPSNLETLNSALLLSQGLCS